MLLNQEKSRNKPSTSKRAKEDKQVDEDLFNELIERNTQTELPLPQTVESDNSKNVSDLNDQFISCTDVEDEDETYMETESQDTPKRQIHQISFQDPPLYEPSRFNIDYPYLPESRCPNTLFIFTLRSKYLNNLYTTVPRAYPANWEFLRRKDPIQAWHSLNQTVIKYLNSEYSNQSLVISEDNKPVDNYDIYALKKSLNETVERAAEKYFSEHSEAASTTSTRGDKDLLSKNRDMLTITSRMEEMLQIIQSHATKVIGRDLHPPPTYTIPGPGILGVTSTSTNLTLSKGTGMSRMKRDISYEEI